MQPKFVAQVFALGLVGTFACGDDEIEDPSGTPSLTVSDQTPQIADVVRIEGVFAARSGFVAIVQAVGGEASAPEIGLGPVSVGTTTALDVALERAVVNGEQLYARLHFDSDENGEYDWVPGGSVDPVVEVEGTAVQARFTVTSTRPLRASVLVDDQPVENVAGSSGRLLVKSVVTSTAGFVVINEQVSTSTRTIFGLAGVSQGLNALVYVPLTAPPPSAGNGLEAVIHRDVDQNGTFDQAIDLPLLVDGSRVLAPFTITSSQGN